MSYNNPWYAGTLVSPYLNYWIEGGFLWGNGREYRYEIHDNSIHLTCLTNTLPGDGKPNIATTIVYI